MKFINFGVLLFFVSFSLFLTSCDDDDNDLTQQEEDLVETYAE